VGADGETWLAIIWVAGLEKDEVERPASAIVIAKIRTAVFM